MSVTHVRDIFLERVYELAADEQLDVAIDMICTHMQELLKNRCYAEADLILQLLNPKKVPPVLMIAFLFISRDNKSNLLNRARFFEETKKSILANRGDISDLEGL